MGRIFNFSSKALPLPGDPGTRGPGGRSSQRGAVTPVESGVARRVSSMGVLVTGIFSLLFKSSSDIAGNTCDIAAAAPRWALRVSNGYLTII